MMETGCISSINGNTSSFTKISTIPERRGNIYAKIYN